jgi:hypothetical protein
MGILGLERSATRTLHPLDNTNIKRKTSAQITIPDKKELCSHGSRRNHKNA